VSLIWTPYFKRVASDKGLEASDLEDHNAYIYQGECLESWVCKTHICTFMNYNCQVPGNGVGR